MWDTIERVIYITAAITAIIAFGQKIVDNLKKKRK
jgi:hypothetical protein